MKCIDAIWDSIFLKSLTPARSSFPSSSGLGYTNDAPEEVDVSNYKRDISENGQVWTLSERDVEYLATGCGVLGTGGGGNPTCHKNKLIQMLKNEGNKVKIVKPDACTDEALVLSCAFMGSPAMVLKKLYNDAQITGVVTKMMQHLGISASADKSNLQDKVALMSVEIGGLNGLVPLLCAAMMGLNVVDADLMGRAFPELQMTTASIHGRSLCPITMQDVNGNCFTLAESESNKHAEDSLRQKCIQFGLSSVSMQPLKGSDLKKRGQQVAITGMYELAWRIGEAIHEARFLRENSFPRLDQVVPGAQMIFQGEVAELEQQCTQGFTRGVVTLKRIGETSETDWIGTDKITIDVKNENLMIKDDSGKVLVTVPDLIVLFDSEFNSIATEDLNVGLICYVVVIPAPAVLKTETSLAVVGPKGFQYKDIDYVPFRVQPNCKVCNLVTDRTQILVDFVSAPLQLCRCCYGSS